MKNSNLSTITLTPVKSSNIAAVGCMQKDENTDIVIEFNNGQKYAYYDVPLETYIGLRDAESVGKFFNAEIRGKFEEEILN